MKIKIIIFDKSDKNKENAFDVLKKFRMENIDNVIIGSLNINSLGHKIDALREIIGNNFDILIIIETKLDDSYPDNQFHIEGFQIPFRVDRNKFGGCRETPILEKNFAAKRLIRISEYYCNVDRV